MINTLLQKYRNSEFNINFNDRIELKFEVKPTTFVMTVIKQDIDRKQRYEKRTPFCKIAVASVPEITSGTVYLRGSSDSKLSYVCEKTASYLKNAIYTAYCYANNIETCDDKSELSRKINNEIIKPLLEREVEYTCPVCHKKHIGNDPICEECKANNTYTICSQCGEVITNMDKVVEKNGTYVCYNCLLTLPSKWRDYGDKPEPKFIALENENTNRYYGFELEVERNNCQYGNVNSSKIISHVCQHTYFKNDGSLNSGFEIISEPCSLKYHSQHLELLDIVKKLGYQSEDTTGLHIHVGKNVFGDTTEQKAINIGRILALNHHFFDDFLAISGRDSSELDYCSDMTNVPDGTSAFKVYNLGCPDMQVQSSDELFKQYLVNFYRHNSRYRAMNIFFTPTVEYRLPRATLDKKQFIAQMQVFDVMIDIAISDIDFFNKSFKDLFYGKYSELDSMIDKYCL